MRYWCVININDLPTNEHEAEEILQQTDLANQAEVTCIVRKSSEVI